MGEPPTTASSPSPPGEPLLDLTERAAHLWVRDAEGAAHDLLGLDDLGLNARREISRSWARCNQLTEKPGDLTKAEEREYHDRMQKIVRLLVPSLPVKAVKAMGFEQREALVTAFFSHRLIHTVTRNLANLLGDNPSAGMKPSPASNASTGTPDEADG